MTARNYSSTTPVSVLSAGIGPGDLTMTLSSSAASFPPPPFTMLLSPDTVNEEVVDVTAASGSVFTITRGVDGTTPKTHATGAQATHGVSARDFAEANDFVNTMTAKGDLLTRDVSGEARLPVGADGFVLTADSAEATGVKWAAASGGGGGADMFLLMGA